MSCAKICWHGIKQDCKSCWYEKLSRQCEVWKYECEVPNNLIFYLKNDGKSNVDCNCSMAYNVDYYVFLQKNIKNITNHFKNLMKLMRIFEAKSV